MVDAVILLTELTVMALALELICLEVSVGPSWRQIASLEHERIVGLGQSLTPSQGELLDNSRIRQLADWTTRRLDDSRTGHLAD